MTNDTADERASTRLGDLRRRSRALSAILLSVPAIASACTVCDSDTGQQVRAGIFGVDLWRTMLAVIAPFVVTLAGVALGMSALFRQSVGAAAPKEAQHSS